MSHHEKRAESVADKLRKLAQTVDQLSWDLDAALSALNKDAAGYRARSPANPDGGRNAEPGELEAVLTRAELLLSGLASVQAYEIDVGEDLPAALGWKA